MTSNLKSLSSFHQLKNLLGYPPDRLSPHRGTCLITALPGLWAPHHLYKLLESQPFIEGVRHVRGRKFLVTLKEV